MWVDLGEEHKENEEEDAFQEYRIRSRGQRPCEKNEEGKKQKKREGQRKRMSKGQPGKIYELLRRNGD